MTVDSREYAPTLAWLHRHAMEEPVRKWLPGVLTELQKQCTTTGRVKFALAEAGLTCWHGRVALKILIDEYGFKNGSVATFSFEYMTHILFEIDVSGVSWVSGIKQ